MMEGSNASKACKEVLMLRVCVLLLCCSKTALFQCCIGEPARVFVSVGFCPVCCTT